jgi:hypothetical protein
MLPMTKQFNVELPAGVVKKIKLDAVALDATLSNYTATALILFLSLPDSERRSYLSTRKLAKK